jgi:lipid II:glycine glycyltransferase (peptidoglycan interpeptide bridge formation enzyme)
MPANAESVTVKQVGLEADGSFGAKWNEFVAAAEYGHLQQGWENGLLKARHGWRPLWLWVERESVAVAGGLLLLRFLPGNCVSVATMPYGPVWRPGCLDLAPAVLSAATEHCRRQRAILCRVHPLCPPKVFAQVFPLIREKKRILGSCWSYWNLQNVRMVADLSGDPMMRISADMRKEIRRSHRLSVRVRVGGVEQVPVLAHLMTLMSDRKHVRVKGEDHFRILFETYPPDRIVIFTAETNGEPVAAALVVTFGAVAYHLYGAFAYDKRHLHPTQAIQAAIIQWACEAGCQTYDMGGPCTSWPPCRTDKGYGVYRFKTQLGARALVSAPYVDLVYRPLSYAAAFVAENLGMPFLIERGLGRFEVAMNRLRENLWQHDAAKVLSTSHVR